MGLNWKFIASVLPAYGSAVVLTVKIALVGIFFSTVLGAFCGAALYHGESGPLAKGIKCYVELSRNTPLAVHLFFLYYGLPKLGVLLSNETCAVIGLTFLGGSYMAESFRSGLDAVSRAQVESGLSLGLSTSQLFRFVVLPQAISIAVPSLGANCVFLFKETSVVSIVALRDIMSVTKELIGMYYNTAESLLILVVCYLLLLLPVSFLFMVIERRTRYAEFGI